MSRSGSGKNENSRMSWVEVPPKSGLRVPNGSSSSASELAHCSLCGHPFNRETSKVFPFCSVRCQQIDLGHWLDERHGLPVEGQEDQEYTGQED